MGPIGIDADENCPFTMAIGLLIESVGFSIGFVGILHIGLDVDRVESGKPGYNLRRICQSVIDYFGKGNAEKLR